MRKRLTAVIISVLTVLGLGAAPALAWTYGLSGSGQCQSDGSYKITWTIDNSTENETLTVKSSSNTTAVPVGTTVAANQSADFTETESGTAPGTYNLTLDVNWPSDTASHVRTASVTLTSACTQPTPPPVTPPTTPPTGGRGGGGTVTTTSTTTTSTPVVPQVTPPQTPAVNAGDGAATYTSPLAVGGLAASLLSVAAGLGLRRFKAHKLGL